MKVPVVAPAGMTTGSTAITWLALLVVTCTVRAWASAAGRVIVPMTGAPSTTVLLSNASCSCGNSRTRLTVTALESGLEPARLTATALNTLEPVGSEGE